MDGAEFCSFVEDACKLAGELCGGSIIGFDSGAKFLLDGFDFADTGAVAQIGLAAGADALDGGLHVCHSVVSLICIFNFVKKMQSISI